MKNNGIIKVGLVGAKGKMGQAIITQIHAHPELYSLHHGLIHGCDNEIKTDAVLSKDINKLKGADVIVDFSTKNASLPILEFCIKHKIPIVIGTTGFSEIEQIVINKASNEIAILQSANMSLSVNILFKLAHYTATSLPDFEVEIMEAHHRQKKDAPSGTALNLGKIIAKALNHDFESVAKYNRCGITNIRDKEEIGFSVIRGGDIVGTHEVMFIRDGECLSLKSEINDRKTFANGALFAASFLINKPSKLYNMLDALEL